MNQLDLEDLYLRAKAKMYTQMKMGLAHWYAPDTILKIGMMANELTPEEMSLVDPTVKQALFDLFTSGNPQRM